jgi:hypothetical protein
MARRIRAGSRPTGSVLSATLIVLLCWSPGCVPFTGGWDVDLLLEREPSLASHGVARLGDALPHFAPTEQGLALFLCRWDLSEPLRVSLPDTAAEPWLVRLRLALSAWTQALPGLEFVEVTAAPDLEIRLVEAGQGGYMPVGAADTVADCRVRTGAAASLGPGRVDAKMEWASIVVHTRTRTAMGTGRPLSEAEFVGTVMHELGHALGFSGHVAQGRSVMVATRETVRDLGARTLAHTVFEAPTLTALYAVPSGVVVARRAMEADSAVHAERVAQAASVEGLSGPYSRVGDDTALFFWWGEQGIGPRLVIEHWPKMIRDGKAARFDGRVLQGEPVRTGD